MAKMGRPPAPWMYELTKLKLQDNKIIGLKELSDLLGIPITSLKTFFNKIKTVRTHKVENGKVQTLYKVGDIRKSAKNYITPWISKTND